VLNLSSSLPLLGSARIRLQQLAQSRPHRGDAVSAYCAEHPGTLRVGHVLCHCEPLRALRTADLLDSPEELVLLDERGTVLMQMLHDRIRSIECAPASECACRAPHHMQSEEHLFIRFEDDQGAETQLEISMGALDDVGPIRQLCEYLRSRTGFDTRAA